MSDVVPGQALATTSGQPVTELSTLLQGLSTQQQLAMKALVEGRKHVDAAEVAGVTRVTLWRWINHDPQFAAAYEAWQQELRGSAHACLLKALDDAAKVVTQAVAGGDARLAWRMLQELVVRNTATSKTPKTQLQVPTISAAADDKRLEQSSEQS